MLDSKRQYFFVPSRLQFDDWEKFMQKPRKPYTRKKPTDIGKLLSEVRKYLRQLERENPDRNQLNLFTDDS